MDWMRWANWKRIAPVFLYVAIFMLPGCGSGAPGRMDWIEPVTTAPRVGTVYCIRGWTGVFSAGIDEMAHQLKKQGVTALCYMPEQYPELGAAMVEKYKGVPNHEPICFIGHSRGVDTSLIVSRRIGQGGRGRGCHLLPGQRG